MSHLTRIQHYAKLHPTLIFLLAGLTGLLIFYYPVSTKQARLTNSPAAIEATAQSPAVKSKPATQKSIGEAYGKLPLSFEANHGQTDSRVKFLSRGPGYGLFLTSGEAVLTLQNEKELSNPPAPGHNPQSAVLRMKVSGAHRDPQIMGVDELPGKTNYFISQDPKKWVTDVPTYAKILYHDIYAGVDLIYYGNQRQLEYDFRVAPHVDPSVIKLKFEGASKLEVNREGDLVLHVAGEELRQLKPIIYQEMDGVRQMVAGSYVLKGKDEIGFQLGSYDRTRPLVIDPVLSYSTYLGGNFFDQGYAIAVDSAGNAYVAGTTASMDFPTTAGAYQTTYSSPLSGGDGFITKFNAAGSALVYSTFLAGASCNGIALDAAGNAYVTGETGGLNFPITPGAFRTAQWGYEIFITKLNATGSALIYSSRFGGNFDDFGRDIALDAAGNAYITGWTVCRAPTCTFPVVNAFQPVYGGGNNDGFVTKMNASGTALVYSTYLGGGQIINATDDWGEGIAVDAAGSAYVTGYTYSPDFPVTPGAYDRSRCGLDAFITKFTPSGTSLVYSTFLGGCGREQGNAIALDASGNAYITGLTESEDNPFTPEIDGFPVTPGAFQTTGSFDAFVTKLNATGTALIYSTYLGGTNDVERGWGIAIDGAGNAYVTGDTKSFNFPTANAVQPNYGGGLSDAFVAKLNATGSALAYSTFLGGTLTDEARGIAVDSSGNAYVTGDTSSYDFPTTPNAFQLNNGGGLENHDDAFVVKIASLTTPPLTHSISGRVTNGTSGVGGVNISLTGTQAGTATTDATGNYSFLNLAAGGNYTVKPTRTGYIFAPSSYLYTNLSADQTSQNFTATAVATAPTISGTVKFGTAGLSGVTVRLTSPTPVGFTARTTTTSSTGAYSFPNVPAGRNYTVTPTKTGYLFTPASKSLLNLSTNQTAVNFLVKVYSITGRITRTGTTAGISAVTVTITSPVPAGFPARMAQTDSSGIYTFTNLPAGRNYTLMPTKNRFGFSPATRSITNLSSNISAGAYTNFTGMR